MQIFINGQAQEVIASNIDSLIQTLGIEKRVCAVALNERVVKKEEWGNTSLQENDRLECLQFMGGG
ncbi:sulfur carrier protein ThiS [Helicobacter mehlei]|uniref:Sulfur carrier protein ThiS n=1 Tax=Helicobacter mehlei TaxID=2316080 RepID=A0A553V0I3_9HELI|nr:sulfur carrier protein ThiS [Helicobacter mehlei]TSA85978.1 sulfur carrier protein ThiS [Helicobacter mehlei]